MSREEAFVVGDLHIGAGDFEPALEDFYQDDAFAEFVARISQPGTTLFINGDFVDFPQIPPYDVPKQSHLLWNEATSLDKLETAAEAHPKVFHALQGFLAGGGNLRILIGNHDLDLAWPGTQEFIRRRLEPVSEAALRFSLTHERYHGVHIEHGHMFTPENAPHDAASFIHEWPEGSGDRYLERVWGTDFMLQFYNQLERSYPFADAVKPMGAVLFQGLKNHWVGGREIVRFVLFLKRRGIPWKGIVSSVLAGEPPAFTDVVGALEENDWRTAVLNRARQDPTFREEVTRELEAIPETDRAILASSGTVKGGEVSLVGEKGPGTLGLFRENRELRAARDWLARPGVTHVVYGHTHEVLDGALEGRLFNHGTWLPRLDLASPAVKDRLEAEGLTLDMLKDERLYVAERKVVHIVPDPPGPSRLELITV